jgi:hypothetical protein
MGDRDGDVYLGFISIWIIIKLMGIKENVKGDTILRRANKRVITFRIFKGLVQKKGRASSLGSISPNLGKLSEVRKNNSHRKRVFIEIWSRQMSSKVKAEK